jgi:sterol desaturase/sphingolipid hydroxylase (fatty acid hydroxylase superfamily)
MNDTRRAPVLAPTCDVPEARWHDRVQRWVHPVLLTLVAAAMLAVPAEHASTAFLAVAVSMIVLLGTLEAWFPFEARSKTHRSDLPGVLAFGLAAYGAGKLADPVSAALVDRLPVAGSLRDLPLLAELAVALVAVELCFYAWHRAGHEVPLLWRLHRAHHLPTKVNLGTYFVFHPVDAFAFAAVRFVPLLALGVSEQAFFLVTTVGFAHKLLCHSNVGGPMGALSRVLGTAENHRIHHSRDPHEAGNYGFVLPLWDHVFGTFVHLDGRTPRAYGTFDGDTPPAWMSRLLTPAPPRSVRLRQSLDHMADLDDDDRRQLVRVREQRLHPLGEHASEAERARVLADLDHYTHVTRGLDADGVCRYFSAYRFERSADGRRMDILLGPQFKERGVHVAAPRLQLMWHITMAFARNPFVELTFGSAVSIAGYALLNQYRRGVGSLDMPGDPDLHPATASMLERLRASAGGKVQWDEDRKLIRYPVGVDLPEEEVRRLDLTPAELDRYLSRCPDAVGRGSSAVVPVAFTATVRQLPPSLLLAARLWGSRFARRGSRTTASGARRPSGRV